MDSRYWTKTGRQHCLLVTKGGYPAPVFPLRDGGEKPFVSLHLRRGLDVGAR